MELGRFWGPERSDRRHSKHEWFGAIVMTSPFSAAVTRTCLCANLGGGQINVHSILKLHFFFKKKTTINSVVF